MNKETTPVKKTISPFKDQKLLEEEINKFANRFKATVSNQAKRISDYFEMACFNYIVQFYEHNGYTLVIRNLQGGKYKYKCSPSGVQSNFSNFEASFEVDGKEQIFEIQHNLAVQSSQDPTIFTSPDISVIKKDSIKITTEYYDSRQRFCYVNNEDLLSFCEVKQFTPYPELLINFIGVLNELKKEYVVNMGIQNYPLHIAPSLMISGKPNRQANNIKRSLEERYWINIIYDLFYSGSVTFSRKKVKSLRTTGRNNSL
ncbi:MAG: hypothetical protein Q8M15_08940 [Bacteroidota bacterium]|nr:hypothetical protein [Bacteroidota bacterium]